MHSAEELIVIVVGLFCVLFSFLFFFSFAFSSFLFLHFLIIFFFFGDKQLNATEYER